MGYVGAYLGSYVGEYFGASEVLAPIVAVVAPLAAEAGTGDEVVVEVSDNTDLAYIAVFASFGGGRKEVVFRRGGFEPGYTIGSYVTRSQTAGRSYLGSFLGRYVGSYLGGLDGFSYTLHIRRDARWPVGPLAITVDAVDTEGNLGD